MTRDELMNIRRYLVSASKRLTALTRECGIDTFYQWRRFNDSWCAVYDYMKAHPELPYVC